MCSHIHTSKGLIDTSSRFIKSLYQCIQVQFDCYAQTYTISTFNCKRNLKICVQYCKKLMSLT